jgi:UDP-N-acetyl-2-amino-2-deoxyglucuronate dehydrogenase
LRPWNIDGLSSVSQNADKKVFTILQLRLHESVIALKRQVEDQLKSDPNHIFDVELTYITSRGNWYYASWKGDEEKSGGIATNIGVHFFDMLHWIFGPLQQQKVHARSHDRASGVLRFKNANVRWFLSINAATLPEKVVQSGGRIHRSLRFDQWSFDFTEGFTELHSRSYAHILNDKGFSERDAQPAISIVHGMRESLISPLDSEAHPLASLPQDPHPFYPLK